MFRDNNDISAQDYRSLQMQGYNQAIRPNSHRRKKSSRRKRLPSYGNGPGATKSIRRVPQLQRAPKSQQVASPLAVPQRQPRLPPPPQTRPLQTGYTDGLAQKLADARTRVATAAVQGVHGTLDAATAHAERVLSQPWIKHPAADSNTPKGDVANPDIESTESDAGPMEYGDSQIADYECVHHIAQGIVILTRKQSNYFETQRDAWKMEAIAAGA